MTIHDLFLPTALVFLGVLVFRHFNITNMAREAARRYTQKQGVILLDQTVIQKGMALRFRGSRWPVVERRYGFEFSTVGDYRYQGKAVYHGRKCVRMELQPFKPVGGDDLDRLN